MTSLKSYIALLFSSMAYATVWYVHPDSALNSITAAMNSCSTDDTVLVGPGIYNEMVVWPEVQGIDLISEWGPDSTIIFTNLGSGIVIYLLYGDPVDSTTRITGFTIQNGTECGMAVHNCSAVITNNVFVDNGSSTGFYGVLDCERGSPTITGNVFEYNTGFDFKGAIACECDSFDTPCITDNTIAYNSGYSGIHIVGVLDAVPMSRAIIKDNSIEGSGLSGIHCWYPAVIRHNECTGNTHYGIALNRCLVTDIDSCTISDNLWSGIFKYPSMTPGDSVTVSHCNIEGNADYGICNLDSTAFVIAENNWWGHASGPYHPDSNPSGLGDKVSDWVDFTPWLDHPVGVEEDERLSSSGPFISINPNPFRHETRIRYQTTDRREVEIGIFDVSGRVVRRFDCETVSVSNRLTWDGTDDHGRQLPSGIYFLTMKVGNHPNSNKVLLIR